MKHDEYGIAYTDTNELCELLYQNPELSLERFAVLDPVQYNESVKNLYADMPFLQLYQANDMDLEDFDQEQQSQWHMPDEYKTLDIAQWILNRCDSDAELQRCGEELLLFQERDLFDLLRYMKYLVDTLRANGVVWGVGRGSSVASYVLYKIGIHKINSLYYDLDPREFLK